MINGKNVTLKMQNNTILNDVSFNITKNKITFFLGKSGAGKTSLLRCIANLNDSYTGDITFQGQDLKKLSPQQRARHVGFVAQSFNLFPHMTALENCTHPLQTVTKCTEKEALEKATAILTSLNMHSFANIYPARLSGGQQQRIAIARALCLNPEVLLLDEPTSALDPENTQSLALLIQQLLANNLTLCISSHDVSFVKKLLDRAYLFDHGKIIQTYDKNDKNNIAEEAIMKFLE